MNHIQFKFKSNLLLTLIIVVSTSCSQSGFQSENLSSTNTPNPTANNPSGQNTNESPATNLDDINLQGRVDSNNSQFKNALAFDFDKTKGEFIIMLPMPSGFYFTPNVSFSKYPDIRLTTLIDPQTNRMKLALRIPVKYIVKGMQTTEPSKLPNGDELPLMPQGYQELPSLALNFPANNTEVHLYIGVNAIGLYMSLPKNLAIPVGFTFPIRSPDKSVTYGAMTYVPIKGNHPPGIFVSSLVPAKVSRILEDYFHL